MLSSTPFQFLPPHVVRLIVNHIVGSSRQAFAGFEPNSNEWSTLLKPLLWICHNFRAVQLFIFSFLVGKEVAERNILDFVQHIKLMAPSTKDIWVRPPSDTSICVSSSPIYNSLVSKIFQLANCIQYSETNMLLALVELKLELGGICNLVHIKFTAFHCDKNFRELVHQSSITLESLVVKSSRGIYIPSIVRGKDGDFVTYPCLHTLKLCGNPIDLEKPQPFLVFTPTSHPKLRYVRTWNSINLVPRVFATNLEALKFAMGIAPRQNDSLEK
ncbi:hypothetical protein GGI03_000452 [Coemansia sp. RSA 2337]|nr:hypothetical protein GGI03_000452 [Coemansia sp. RSA 2337]